MRETLEKLLEHPRIWRGNRAHTQTQHAGSQALSTGYPALDEHLPGGGWPRAALSEIVVERYGTGELKLILPALAELTRTQRVVWVSPPYIPYAPALTARGIDIDNMLVLRPGKPDETLWAGEQCLRSGVCAAVLLWVGGVNEKRLRRLQLAAEHGDGIGVLFRPPAVLEQTTPAALRLQLASEAGGSVRAPAGRLIHVRKSRGGRPVTVRADFL
ncbi:MAG: translesion DNA synthesis-associated protein ImuA [Pseudomonadota bacterium]